MINIEYKDSSGNFPLFYKNIVGKSVLIICDANTKVFANKYLSAILNWAKNVDMLVFDSAHLVPDVETCNRLRKKAKNCNYILAVGSGTLNDLAKLISTQINIACGVVATAPSMDGYVSKNAAFIENNTKMAAVTHMPQDVLIDLDIVCNAPKIMVASGVGDILGKFTCLADWQLSNILYGEPINKKAFDMMMDALQLCLDNFDGIVANEAPAIATLMNALLTAGLAMAENGDSRPASGSEHHISHYLEMEFLKNNKDLAPHGIQVGIGTLAALTVYKNLYRFSPQTLKIKAVEKLIDSLPEIEYIRSLLTLADAPTKFSQISVDISTLNGAIKNAHTLRPRFTILTLINNLQLENEFLPLIYKECY